jgi:DNA-directed RNA polymerase subunit RPC12/RpoP
MEENNVETSKKIGTFVMCYKCKKRIWKCKSNKEEISCPRCHYKIKFSMVKVKFDNFIKHLNQHWDQKTDENKSKEITPHEEIPKKQESKEIPKNQDGDIQILDQFGNLEKTIKVREEKYDLVLIGDIKKCHQ